MLVYEHSLHSLAARKMTNTPKCNNHSISVNTRVNKCASITALYVGFYSKYSEVTASVCPYQLCICSSVNQLPFYITSCPHCVEWQLVTPAGRVYEPRSPLAAAPPPLAWRTEMTLLEHKNSSDRTHCDKHVYGSVHLYISKTTTKQTSPNLCAC